MRILYFSQDYTAHDRRFLTALSQTAHQVYYLRLERRHPGPRKGELPERIQKVNWRCAQGPLNLSDTLGLLPQLRRVIGDIRPDLIHAGPLQKVARLAAMARPEGLPLVSMSWGSDLLLDADRDAEWGAATRLALQHSTLLLGDCQAVEQKAVEFGFPRERIVLFPWGVDLRHFSPVVDAERRPRYSKRLAQNWQTENAFVMLCLRAWEPLYGVDMVAKAFVQAASTCPDLRLLLLGQGSQAEQIHQILLQGEVLDRVAFPGHVGLKNLPLYYQAADLYLSASHSDGSSVSLMEALACGIPALVSDIPSNREWISPGAQGWLFPDGDVNALAEAMLAAYRDRARLPAMGRAAHLLAEERADWDQNFQKLLEAYERAVHEE